MQRQIQGQFPALAFGGTHPSGTNINDGAGSLSWTTGQQAILVLPTQPNIARRWTIYGVAFTFEGFLYSPGGVGGPPYGKLGRLSGGPLFGNVTATPSNTGGPAPFVGIPQSALPNIATLWDGEQDSAFPMFITGPGVTQSTGGYRSVTNVLPQPIELDVGSQLGVGLWLSPSLVNNTQIFIANTTFSVIYDDGNHRR